MIYGVVKEQRLSARIAAVADTINYLTAEFSFLTADWSGLVVYAHFKKGEDYYSVQLENGKITPEDHLNLTEGEWELYLHGNEYKDGEVIKRITTNVIKFTVEPTGALEGEPFPEVEPSVVEQLAADIADHEERIEGLETEVAEQRSYNNLDDKPSINGVVLQGNKTNRELNIPNAGDAVELYDSFTGKPIYTVDAIDDLYARGTQMTWKGRPVIAVYANTMWNRFLYFPRADAGRQVLIKKQSVQNGAVIGDEESVGGFSDINFTLNHYNRLYGIEAGAQVNKVEDVQDSEGNTVVDDNKVAHIPVIPSRMSQLQNDSGYIQGYDEVLRTETSSYTEFWVTGEQLLSNWTAGAPLTYDLYPIPKVQDLGSAIRVFVWSFGQSYSGLYYVDFTDRNSTRATPLQRYTRMLNGTDYARISTGGTVTPSNPKFVTGGTVYDAINIDEDTMIELCAEISDVLATNGDYLGYDGNTALAF